MNATVPMTDAEAIRVVEAFALTQGFHSMSLEFFEHMQALPHPKPFPDHQTRVAYAQVMRGFRALFAPAGA